MKTFPAQNYRSIFDITDRPAYNDLLLSLFNGAIKIALRLHTHEGIKTNNILADTLC